MKGIYIYGVTNQSGSLYLQDDDDSDITEYTKRLTSLLKSENVVILETTDGNAILKPNKVDAIFVTDVKSLESFEDLTMYQKQEEAVVHIDLTDQQTIDLETDPNPEEDEELLNGNEDVVSDEEE